MKIINYQIKYDQYPSVLQLDEMDRKLVIKAREAAMGGYAPYSGFRVGAAVLLENGAIVIGNNQENAAYPSGLCAERTALFSASAQYPKVPIIAVAISAIDNMNQHTPIIKPCGACRQVMAEYEDLANKSMRILLDGNDGVFALQGIDNLLPLRFKNSDLK